MKTIHVLPLCVTMLASCGEADGSPTHAPRPRDAVRSTRDPTRPGTWRRFTTSSPSGLIEGAVAKDAGGSRMVILRDGGFDAWTVALDCTKRRFVPSRGMAVRGGRWVGSANLPPTSMPRAVAQICTTGRPVGRDTLEAVVDGIRIGATK